MPAHTSFSPVCERYILYCSFITYLAATQAAPLAPPSPSQRVQYLNDGKSKQRDLFVWEKNTVARKLVRIQSCGRRALRPRSLRLILLASRLCSPLTQLAKIKLPGTQTKTLGNNQPNCCFPTVKSRQQCVLLHFHLSEQQAVYFGSKNPNNTSSLLILIFDRKG